MILTFLAILQTTFFAFLNRASILSPLFLIIITTFFFQYLISPLLIIYGGKESIELNFQSYQYTLLILNFVLFFWFVGFTLVSNKEKFSFVQPDVNNQILLNNNIYFGFFCLFAGLIVYVAIFLYSGYGFLEALANPLQFRFDIIGLTGGYYLRNLSIWLLDASIIILLIYFFRNIKESYIQKIQFIIFSLFIFILLIPFGQRFILLIPFLAAGFILYNDKVISNFAVLVGLLAGMFLLSITGLYRTLAYFGPGNLQDLFFLIQYTQIFDSSDFSREFISRFDNLSWFRLYLSEELYLENTKSFIESIKQLLIILVPPSLLGGIEKEIDYDTFLTIYFLGSQDFGTYGFTPMAEWSMNFGKIGYVLMPLISGILTSYICNSFRLIKVNMFYLIFFSSFIFLELIFISFHSYATANTIVFLFFNTGLFLFYKIFFYDVSMKNRK